MGRVYRGESLIDAPPEAVWAVLVDLERYPDWNPFTVAVRSSLEVGAPVELDVYMAGSGKVLQRVEHVRRHEPLVALDWGMALGGGLLLRAERTQRLLPREGGTRYVTEDLIEGPLTPLVHRMFGDSMQVGFSGVARALRDEVHRRNAKGT